MIVAPLNTKTRPILSLTGVRNTIKPHYNYIDFREFRSFRFLFSLVYSFCFVVVRLLRFVLTLLLRFFGLCSYSCVSIFFIVFSALNAILGQQMTVAFFFMCVTFQLASLFIMTFAVYLMLKYD